MVKRTSVRKAIIPAAGLGTRFLPLTKAQPKEMLPIVDKPMIQYVVQEAVYAGIEDILIVTGRGKRSIEDHFDKAFELERRLEQKSQNPLQELEDLLDAVSIHYVRQKEPLGLGHAIGCGKQHVGGEPFAVMLGDDIFVSDIPVIQQIMTHFDKQESSVMSVQTVPKSEANRYGMIKGRKIAADAYELEQIIEKPKPEESPSQLAAFGRYVFTPELFDALAITPPGKNNEIQLSDGVNLLLERQPVYGVMFRGKRYDAGDKLGLIVANIELALQREDLRNGMKAYLEALAKKGYDGE